MHCPFCGHQQPPFAVHLERASHSHLDVDDDRIGTSLIFFKLFFIFSICSGGLFAIVTSAVDFCLHCFFNLQRWRVLTGLNNYQMLFFRNRQSSVGRSQRSKKWFTWREAMCSTYPCVHDWCDSPPGNKTIFQARPSQTNGLFFAAPRGCLMDTEGDWFWWIRNDSFCTSPWCRDLWSIIIYIGERLNSLL